MKNIAIILGGGTSQRCGFDKLFIEKYGKPVIFQTLETFQVSQKIDEILLVLHKKNLEKTNELKNYFPKIKEVIPSGKERVFSLQNAINSLKYSKNENSRIIVHNGANPKILQHELET
jgi:2-C-methyl-D-erythritol 4-phosphate cytidylyltransferase